MHFFLRKHTYFHGIEILLDLKVMHKTFIIGSIFNVPLQTKTAFMGPLLTIPRARREFGTSIAPCRLGRLRLPFNSGECTVALSEILDDH